MIIQSCIMVNEPKLEKKISYQVEKEEVAYYHNGVKHYFVIESNRPSAQLRALLYDVAIFSNNAFHNGRLAGYVEGYNQGVKDREKMYETPFENR